MNLFYHTEEGLPSSFFFFVFLKILLKFKNKNYEIYIYLVIYLIKVMKINEFYCNKFSNTFYFQQDNV